MAQKYDLTDIGNALSRVMDNPMTKIIRSGSIGVLGVVNPVAGIVGGIGNDLLSEYNTFKLGHLLNGLASGFNLERRLNELYNYVNSSPEKAIIVANLFKQTVNAECPKVCVIYGLILANHLETLNIHLCHLFGGRHLCMLCCSNIVLTFLTRILTKLPKSAHFWLSFEPLEKSSFFKGECQNTLIQLWFWADKTA